MKFRVVRELATICRGTVKELLKHASLRVLSYITKILLVDLRVVTLIDEYLCGLDFYREHIMLRSWLMILQN